MILLKDPLVEFFTVSKPFTKDLFFSGHTATMFLMFLFVKGRFYKSVFLAGTVVLGLSVILQHVHYSIDVVTAPVFSYLAYRIVNGFGINSSMI
jgi:membrane-associated phospholipid phosphatase